MREIVLSGAEITVLKTIGLTGTTTSGANLVKALSSMEEAELIDTLKGLLVMGYILAEQENFKEIKEVEEQTFRVNTAYAKELRDTVLGRTHRKENAGRRRRRG